MAIGFGRAGHNSSASPASPLVVTVTINAGETAVLCWEDSTGTGGITSLPAGWTKRTSNAFAGAAGRVNTELWSTDAGAASGVASVSIAFNGAPAAIAAVVGAYTGVLGIGNVATPVQQSTGSPTIARTTQDANNWVVAAIGSNDGSDGAYVTLGAGVTMRDEGLVSSVTDAHVGLTDNTSVSAGNVSNGVTYPNADYSLVALELRSVAAGAATYVPYDLAHTAQHQGMVAQ